MLLMKNSDVSREVLNLFSKQGVLISVDDFGTGYSSLAYLDTFDINIIKLDRQFILKLTEQTSVNQIVRSIIELAKQLEYKVVAEGVETKEQLDLIKSYGCHYAPKDTILLNLCIRKIFLNGINKQSRHKNKTENHEFSVFLFMILMILAFNVFNQIEIKSMTLTKITITVIQIKIFLRPSFKYSTVTSIVLDKLIKNCVLIKFG